MTNINELSEEEKQFEKHWLTCQESAAPLDQDFKEIRDYARLAFDKLDLDKNGFIERSELFAHLSGGKLGERERSFIIFLLNNQQAIADMTREDSPAARSSISRSDLESYFGLILNLLGD